MAGKGRFKYQELDLRGLAQRYVAGESANALAHAVGAPDRKTLMKYLDPHIKALGGERRRWRPRFNYQSLDLEDLARRRIAGESGRALAREVGAPRWHPLMKRLAPCIEALGGMPERPTVWVKLKITEGMRREIEAVQQGKYLSATIRHLIQLGLDAEQKQREVKQ